MPCTNASASPSPGHGTSGINWCACSAPEGAGVGMVGSADTSVAMGRGAYGQRQVEQALWSGPAPPGPAAASAVPNHVQRVDSGRVERHGFLGRAVEEQHSGRCGESVDQPSHGLAAPAVRATDPDQST